jgi:hypothetical protein
MKEEKINSLHPVETSFLTFKNLNLDKTIGQSKQFFFINEIDFYLTSMMTRTFFL